MPYHDGLQFVSQSFASPRVLNVDIYLFIYEFQLPVVTGSCILKKHTTEQAETYRQTTNQTSKWSITAFLNKCTCVISRTDRGREFQTIGPQIRKALDAVVVLQN